MSLSSQDIFDITEPEPEIHPHNEIIEREENEAHLNYLRVEIPRRLKALPCCDLRAAFGNGAEVEMIIGELVAAGKIETVVIRKAE